MSQGKYSPTVYNRGGNSGSYTFNCYGQVPAAWNSDNWNSDNYDEKTMFGNYDSEGYDSYGYSAFYADGTYAGVGGGIDRNGITELEYLTMSSEEFADCY